MKYKIDMYRKYVNNINIPCILLSLLDLSVGIITINNNNIMNGISNCLFWDSIGMLFGIADTAITDTIFNMFAPKIFPTDISWWFFLIAVIDETISGREVPSAIIVKLTIPWGIFKKLAIITPLDRKSVV